ncbi:SUF system NifU family Fe-S cluster assembly protein [bacterium]|nr:SUF system NifU family Fe-S cluster assembly protein [bacterium]
MTQVATIQKETPNIGELYQEIIVEHSKRPRCKGRVEGCQFCLEGKNPLCGDQITLYCQLATSAPGSQEPRITVAFEGSGCSISQASTSMMCEAVSNKTVTEARAQIEKVEAIYTGRAERKSEDDIEEDVEALQGVSQFPVRIKCAALAWKTLELLLNENFDERGFQRLESQACKLNEPCGSKSRRLSKIITTE